MAKKTMEYTTDTPPISEYRLPRYREIPDVGLYLNQVARYINDCMAPFPGMAITESMISNYVKKGVIANPVKKQYNRDQLAYLMFMAAAKSVLSIDQIRQLFALQEQTCSSAKAYDCFCDCFEDVLQYAFGMKTAMEEPHADRGEAFLLLHKVMVTVGHKLFLDHSFRELSSGKGQ